MLIVPFQIHDQTYAVDARAVKRVLPYCEPQVVLEGRAPIVGLAQYDGREIPILDLVRLLGDRPHHARLSTRCFLVEIPYHGYWHYVLLLAEGVTGTRKVTPPRSHDEPVIAPDKTYLGPVIRHDGWQIQMIEVDQILEESDFDDLFPPDGPTVVVHG